MPPIERTGEEPSSVTRTEPQLSEILAWLDVEVDDAVRRVCALKTRRSLVERELHWIAVDEVLPALGRPCEVRVRGSSVVLYAEASVSREENRILLRWLSPIQFIVHGVTHWRYRDGADECACFSVLDAERVAAATRAFEASQQGTDA